VSNQPKIEITTARRQVARQEGDDDKWTAIDHDVEQDGSEKDQASIVAPQ
jgi:hypothetical protein